MSEFMILLEADEQELPPAETMALVESHAAYERKLRAAHAYLDGERLRPSVEGSRVRVRDGHAQVEAGPFSEKPLNGYYVLAADSLDEAVKLAEDCPMSPGAELDVRPLIGGSFEPEKTNQPGRVFAFAVLGNAASEQGWVDVMNRIDESSRQGFPIDRLLGGVRLHAPERGRRVASRGARRVIFDGPFLESKEVIGGLFFMRMASPEEAVDWATRTEFVKHGAVEIRELWRS